MLTESRISCHAPSATYFCVACITLGPDVHGCVSLGRARPLRRSPSSLEPARTDWKTTLADRNGPAGFHPKLLQRDVRITHGDPSFSDVRNAHYKRERGGVGETSCLGFYRTGSNRSCASAGEPRLLIKSSWRSFMLEWDSGSEPKMSYMAFAT